MKINKMNWIWIVTILLDIVFVLLILFVSIREIKRQRDLSNSPGDISYIHKYTK